MPLNEHERAVAAVRAGAIVATRMTANRGTGALVVLDLDDFTSVNVKHGSQLGDRLLAEVEAGLRRRFDGSGAVQRLAGDEFMVIVADVADDEALLGVVESVRRTVARCKVRTRWLRRCVTVSATVGFARWHDEQSGKEALRTAATALVVMKERVRRGRANRLGSHTAQGLWRATRPSGW